ncbi:MAG: hypothetical protein Q4G36_11170 [Paracoccus sp. (in: a-proteobacteria)]|nr:hypothetical protein [Paracoccus sp. (in: a-proteobacteria)]
MSRAFRAVLLGAALWPVWAMAYDLTPPAGEVSHDEGLAAWARIEAVVTHPRCANCHVGPDNIPMWTGPEYRQPGPHGSRIDGGESRMGAETLLCSTCHVTSERPNTVPRAAPHAGLDWRLAPVEMQWFGLDGAAICAQLADPARTGGRDGQGLAEHLAEDAEHRGFVLWGWEPGPGRETPPGDVQAHIDDMLIWTAAGQPCPEPVGLP